MSGEKTFLIPRYETNGFFPIFFPDWNWVGKKKLWQYFSNRGTENYCYDTHDLTTKNDLFCKKKKKKKKKKVIHWQKKKKIKDLKFQF